MNALASDFDNDAEFYLHDKINECVKRKCKICAKYVCARVFKKEKEKERS